MVDVITFLDAHAGAITGMATVLLFIATIVLAYLNWQLWLSQDRPMLDFSTKIENITPTPTGIKATIDGEEIGEIVKTGDYVLYVKNIGKGPAFDICFRLPDIDLTSLGNGCCLKVQEENRVTILPGPEYEITGIVYKDVNGRLIKQPPVRRTRDEFSKISNKYSKMKF